MKFITRDYNSISLNPAEGTLTKTSTNSKLIDEMTYFQEISSQSDPYLKLLYPRLISFETTEEFCRMEMEYYPFKNLGNYITDGTPFGEEFWINVLEMLFSVIERMKKTTASYSDDHIRTFCTSMFVDKTLKEYDNLRNDFPFFDSLANFSVLEINGKEYRNFNSIWEEILGEVEELIEEEKVFNVIHGDMCFSNILLGEHPESNSILRLIDPRGAFGIKGVFGSSLYDYAKLSHSISGGYEFFIYDRFKVENTEPGSNKFTLKLIDSVNKEMCEKLFLQHMQMSPNMLRKVKLIEGLIFIGMCARHYDSFERQQAMYLTGVRILNEVINENLC